MLNPSYKLFYLLGEGSILRVVKHGTIDLTGTASDSTPVKSTAVECSPIKITATSSTAVECGPQQTTLEATDTASEGSITQPTIVSDSLLNLSSLSMNLSSSSMDISSCSSSSELSESGECYITYEYITPPNSCSDLRGGRT